MYYEPVSEISDKEVDELLLDDSDKSGFKMGFSAHTLEIEMSSEAVVKPLLRQVRELGEREVVPVGRSGCEDCGKLGEIGKCVDFTVELYDDLIDRYLNFSSEN